MRSLASIVFGITFTIVLMLIAALNRRKSTVAASMNPSERRSPEKEAPRAAAAADDEEIGTVETTEPSPRPGSVITFRHHRKDIHTAPHGSWRH